MNKRLRREFQFVDKHLHWERGLCWDINSWTSFYNWEMMNDNRMGHNVW